MAEQPAEILFPTSSIALFLASASKLAALLLSSVAELVASPAYPLLSGLLTAHAR